MQLDSTFSVVVLPEPVPPLTTMSSRLRPHVASSSATGTSATTDRMIYLNPSCQVLFGVNAASNVKLTTSVAYNDGLWHQVVGTQGPDGMALYVDGQLQASNAVTTASSFTGYWRVGSDKPFSGGGANFFAGSIDEVAVYPTELAASSVQAHYAAAGTVTQNQPPTALFTPTCNSLTCSVDASASSGI